MPTYRVRTRQGISSPRMYEQEADSHEKAALKTARYLVPPHGRRLSLTLIGEPVEGRSKLYQLNYHKDLRQRPLGRPSVYRIHVWEKRI